MPGVSVFKLSPWLCCVPSGSRDQNTSRKGLLRSLNIVLARAFRWIEYQRRTDLSDRSGAIAFVAGKFQNRQLVKIVAGKVLIDIAEHDVILKKGREAIAGARYLKTRIDRI